MGPSLTWSVLKLLLNTAEFAELKEKKDKFKYVEVEKMPKFTEKHRILVTVESVVQNSQNSVMQVYGNCQNSGNLSMINPISGN